MNPTMPITLTKHFTAKDQLGDISTSILNQFEAWLNFKGLQMNWFGDEEAIVNLAITLSDQAYVGATEVGETLHIEHADVEIVRDSALLYRMQIFCPEIRNAKTQYDSEAMLKRILHDSLKGFAQYAQLDWLP